jgi:photosystem II stability/assembly factor-like uncharacterized protein
MRRAAGVVVAAVVLASGCARSGPVASSHTQRSQPSVTPSPVTAASSTAESAPTDSAPVDSAAVSSPVASVPVVSKPPEPVGSPAQDVGDLEQFAQSSATTWWATVVGNLSDQLFLVRTEDAGQHWQDVTPSSFGELHADGGVSSYVLSADVAWVDADAKPTAPQLFRTLDGGRSWQLMGTVSDGCTLQFVDSVHGWCWAADGAAGSMTVDLYRTQDGGVTWRRISFTGGTSSTADALPFGCDKTLTFTSQTVGWASSFCAGGEPYLDTSTDGGARWHAVTPVPFSASADLSEGVGLSVPAVAGQDVAVVDLGGLGPGASAINTSSDGGKSWRLHPLPAPPSGHYWNVDLIDPTHWRATDGDVIISTDDAGMHWQRWTPAVSMHDQYGTLEFDFISPEVGSASDPADRTPLWSTTDGGKTWAKIVIDAGPYVLH